MSSKPIGPNQAIVGVIETSALQACHNGVTQPLSVVMERNLDLETLSVSYMRFTLFQRNLQQLFQLDLILKPANRPNTMKDDKTVIEEFNDVVNMTAAELEKWLKSSDSRSAGWPKDEGGGESIGHESGRKIIEILESNPTKESDKYSVEQIQHMRKVVSYW
jgi:hypothetical protein